MFSLLYGIFRMIFHTSRRKTHSTKGSKAWKHGKRSRTKHGKRSKTKHKGCGFPILWSLPNHFPYFLQINNKASVVQRGGGCMFSMAAFSLGGGLLQSTHE